MVFFFSRSFRLERRNVPISTTKKKKKKDEKKAKDKSLNDSSRNLVLIANGTSKHSYD